MKKVLIITYYWPPSGGAGVQRILKFVKYLPESGILPYVVTVDENKASYPVNDYTLQNDVPGQVNIYRTDTSEPFDFYSKLLGRKSIPTGFSNESNPGVIQKISRFIRGNFFIPDARRGWIKYAFEESRKIIEREKIDTVVTTSPPHSAQLAGLMLKDKLGIRWIADLRDPWTDIYYYNEFSHMQFAKKLDLKFEREVLERADKIVTVSNELKKIFSGKSKLIDEKKIYVIPNGYDEDDFETAKNIYENKYGDFVITYTGTLADSYNPEIFFNALKKTAGKFPETNFKIRFIGNPAATVIESAKKIFTGKHLEVIPTVPHTDSIKYLNESSALLLVIPEIKNDKAILTGKLFEYLASKKPIICIGPEDGDASAVINECQAGKTFDRTNEAGLSDYLEQLVVKWKAGNGIDNENNTYKNYSRKNQTKKLAQIILSS